MPFLRLTRDRRGFENTFLLHADHPGAKPRLLYWYRTAPGILLGRAPLDEDAIRAIEENYPDIEFDWPAILALSEVMTPEEETAERPPTAFAGRTRRDRRPRRDDRAGASRRAEAQPVEHEPVDAEPLEPESEPNPLERVEPVPSAPVERVDPMKPPPGGLVDDLAGREVARALRARYAEIRAKIDRIDGDRTAWLARAEQINPDAWPTPDAVLDGVRNADAAYQKLRTELAHSSRE